MKSLDLYREKFYRLVESDMGNVKPLIEEQVAQAPPAAPANATASANATPQPNTAAQPNTAQSSTQNAEQGGDPQKRNIGQFLKLNGITLVTKYKDSFLGFFKMLNDIVSSDGFCKDSKNRSTQAFKALNDIIVRMASDSKMTNEQVIEFLYQKFNSGLGKLIIEIASQVIKDEATGGVSKEVLDTVFDQMRTTYPTQGPKVNSIVMEIMNKLNVGVEYFCDSESRWSSPE